MRSNSLIAPLALAATLTATAGVYPDAAGQPGSSAIPKVSTLFTAWASGHAHYQPGTDVIPSWQTPAKALGPATDDTFDIVCLGNGGRITLIFPDPVCDGPGADFAVFENGFRNDFLELAFVEVSSNGSDFFRFANTSLTQYPVGGMGSVDPTAIDGFAGKYRVGFGTPFDLSALPDSPVLDKQNIRFIRIVDIIGDGKTKDSNGKPIYDPTPTIGSGGFDLEAIGVIHANRSAPRVLASGLTNQGFLLRWEANPGTTYQILESTNLGSWHPAATLTAPATAITAELLLPTGNTPAKYWKIGRM
jgi:hypothetical protein